MKIIVSTIMSIIWGGIFGMLLGYIGGQLELASVSFSTAAILGAVFAVIATNAIYYITKNANPAKATAKK